MIQVEVKESAVSAWSGTWLDTLGYQVVKVTGIDPVKSNVNTGDISGVDGSYYISEQLAERNIVLTLKPLEFNGKTIEEMRLQLYNLFKLKTKLDLRFKTENRNARISGYVESIQIDPFSNPQLAQVSIICPNPYFTWNSISQTLQHNHGVDEREYVYAEFSFSDYASAPDGDIGFILQGTANADIARMEINAIGVYISIDDYILYQVPPSIITNISAGDYIQYDTRTGMKSVLKNNEPYFSGYDGDFRQMQREAASLDLKKPMIYLSDADGNRLSSDVFTGLIRIYPQFWGL